MEKLYHHLRKQRRIGSVAGAFKSSRSVRISDIREAAQRRRWLSVSTQFFFFFFWTWKFNKAVPFARKTNEAKRKKYEKNNVIKKNIKKTGDFFFKTIFRGKTVALFFFFFFCSLHQFRRFRGKKIIILLKIFFLCWKLGKSCERMKWLVGF